MSYYDEEPDEGPSRLPVYQCGRIVGTVPASFMPDPSASRSPLYDVRPGDWTPTEDGWRANPMLGLGDLAAMPGFVRSGEG